MQRTAVLVPLLILEWIWTLQGLPVLPEPLYPTQENFDLSKVRVLHAYNTEKKLKTLN